jgi:hypothetical protein
VSVCDRITIPFMLCMGKKNRSVSIYQCGKSKIDANTDFLNIYNLTEELELIKTVLFPDVGSKALIDFLRENKVLSVTSYSEKISLDDAYNNYKSLSSDGLNGSLKNVLETRLNILLYKTVGNTVG